MSQTNRKAKKKDIIRYNVLKYTGISGLVRKLKKRPAEVGYKKEIDQFGGFTVAYRGGTTDEDVIKHSFKNDIFFTGVPEYITKEDDIIMDIGAHIGTFSLLAASKVPKGKVFAIEACQETYDYCVENKSLNKLDNIEVCHCALYDSDGTIQLNYDDEAWGHSIMSTMTGRGEEVQSLSMESFMKKYNIEHCNFAKFNCEGAEFPIIMGTPVELLSKFSCMLVLYHLDLAEGSSLDKLEDHFKAAGFNLKYTNVHPNGNRGWLIAYK